MRAEGNVTIPNQWWSDTPRPWTEKDRLSTLYCRDCNWITFDLACETCKYCDKPVHTPSAEEMNIIYPKGIY